MQLLIMYMVSASLHVVTEIKKEFIFHENKQTLIVMLLVNKARGKKLLRINNKNKSFRFGLGGICSFSYLCLWRQASLKVLFKPIVYIFLEKFKP
jgi:hypothetical protein